MSKLKSALLLSVALSPIFVSATCGIEVVHADNAASRPIKVAKAVKNDNAKQVQSKDGDVIAFSDKDFAQRFEKGAYFKKEADLYGDNVPKDDATMAAQDAGFIASIIGDAVKTESTSPALLKTLGFAGPLGATLGFLIDMFTPKASDDTSDALLKLDGKLLELGVSMGNDSKAVGELVKEESINNRLSAFKEKYQAIRDESASIDDKVQLVHTDYHSSLATNDVKALKKYVEEYANLYSTASYGADSVRGGVKPVKDENISNFNNLCRFGENIIDSDSSKNDVFKLMTDYESLKEYFNTKTFATREAFSDDIMNHYSVWLHQMYIAILLDYSKVVGQIDNITSSNEYTSRTAEKFEKDYPITNDLLGNLRRDARLDLRRLGFDSLTRADYKINDYINNNWIKQSSPTSVFVDGEHYTLAANAQAVNYAYARTVENRPTKTAVGIDPDYQAKLAAAQKAVEDADAREHETHYAIPFKSAPWLEAVEKQKSAHKVLDQLKADGNIRYENKVILDTNGQPLPGKLKAEEKTTNDGKIIYSYANKSWVYNRLDAKEFGSSEPIPAWYVAKYFANKHDFAKIDALDNNGWNMNRDTKVVWQGDHKVDNSEWNAALEHLASKDFVKEIQDNANVKGKQGVNHVLDANTSTQKSGEPFLGFNRAYDSTTVATDTYSLDGSKAGSALFSSPYYQVNLGYFKNNSYHEPSKDDKTFYQQIKQSPSGNITIGNSNYDTTPVSLIMIPKDGDTVLSGLNNGNKVPAAPDMYVNQ